MLSLDPKAQFEARNTRSSLQGAATCRECPLGDLTKAAEEEVRAAMFVCQSFSQKNGSSFPGDAV